MNIGKLIVALKSLYFFVTVKNSLFWENLVFDPISDILVFSPILQYLEKFS